MQAVTKQLHTCWQRPHFVNMAAHKPALNTTRGLGYAAYGFCIHRWHTAVPHNGVEKWSYAAVLQNGNMYAFGKSDYVRKAAGCCVSLADNHAGRQHWFECWRGTAIVSRTLQYDGDAKRWISRLTGKEGKCDQVPMLEKLELITPENASDQRTMFWRSRCEKCRTAEVTPSW